MNGTRSSCWPRPGHEDCSCTVGYGPQARLTIRVRELEERLAILEEELARLRAVVGQRSATPYEEMCHGRR
jgi:hypothetical protein